MEFPILLAGGNWHEAFSIRRALRQAGVFAPLRVVADVVEAIEYLSGTGIYADRSRYPVPCLLISDLQLPVVDGFDLRVWLQDQPQFRRLPKVALSDSTHQANLMRSLTMGSWVCFAKPRTFAHFVRLAEHLRDAFLTKAKPRTRAETQNP